MNERLQVRRAGAADVDEIVGVLSEAAGWLVARGIRQWPDPFPRARVAALVERGDFYVASSGGEAVGTLALMWSDPTFWGERPPDAGYVHALAVRRAFAGRGLGGQLLDWAGEQVAAAGREYLRLDCLAGSSELRQYYERHCFELRGEVAVDDFTSALYERRCEPRLARTPVAEASAPPRSVAKSTQSRSDPVTDTCALPHYARSGSEGGPVTPPTEGGGALGIGDPRGAHNAVPWAGSTWA